MQRWLAIGVVIVLLCGGGYVWSQGGAPRGSALAAIPTASGAPIIGDDEALVAPVSDVTPETREARRFGRYDKDKDGAVSREEYLTSRRKAYARLDLDGNGTLSFDEYAAKAAKKFMTADLDRDKLLASAEFATTAAKRRARPVAANCPPAELTAEADREG